MDQKATPNMGRGFLVRRDSGLHLQCHWISIRRVGPRRIGISSYWQCCIQCISLRAIFHAFHPFLLALASLNQTLFVDLRWYLSDAKLGFVPNTFEF